MTIDRLYELGGRGEPCDCGEEDCGGWQITFNTVESIVDGYVVAPCNWTEQPCKGGKTIELNAPGGEPEKIVIGENGEPEERKERAGCISCGDPLNEGEENIHDACLEDGQVRMSEETDPWGEDQ